MNFFFNKSVNSFHFQEDAVTQCLQWRENVPIKTIYLADNTVLTMWSDISSVDLG